MDNLKLILKNENKKVTTFKVGDTIVGKDLFVIAGPCSVESKEQIINIAREVKKSGASALRGGAFKPRTNPYSFQGLGKQGLEFLAEAKKETGLPIVTEVMDTKDVELVSTYADVLQIGARNSLNYSLLKEVAKQEKPVLLKRGISGTIEEWLSSAEYLLAGGNEKVMLCERGIRTYETYLRNTFDLAGLAAAKELTHLPLIADPSHGTGKRSLIEVMSLASISAGANGLAIETHTDPSIAISDKNQTISTKEFDSLMKKVRALDSFTKTKL